MAVRLLPDGRWACYHRKNGKLKWEYFGRGAEGEAAAWRRNNELNLQRRRPPREDYGPAFAEIADSYLANKHFNENSRKHLLIRLEANILPFFGLMPAVRITDNDIDKYIRKRLETPYRKLRDGTPLYPNLPTICRELTDVKAILNWAVKRRPPLIPFNPVANYKKPDPPGQLGILPPTPDEVAAIISNASPHVQKAMKLSYYLGLRPGAVELLRLTWEQSVDWDSRTILVISAQKGGAPARRVPIHPDFLEELKSWYDEDDGQGPLVQYRGRPIRSFKKAWKLALARAGIKRRLRPYDFRHRFVTTALEGGADIKALSEVVGSSPTTLMRFYQHVTSEVHRQTVQKIPAIIIKPASAKSRKPKRRKRKKQADAEKIIKFPAQKAR